jgi:hypothetical protein
MSNISGWIFNYNDYTHLWSAAKREDYFELFNGNKGRVLSSSNIETLIELINKTDGDPTLIEKQINK